MAALANVAQQHLEKYVGTYAGTEDFQFQEQLRKADLILKTLAGQLVSDNEAQRFFVNGWGQVISAAYLLEQNPLELKTSDAFTQYLVERLDQAISKGAEENNPFSGLNVRRFTKAIMMHPTHPTHAGKFFDWQAVPLAQPIVHLNQFMKEAEPRFSFHEGKLYLKINPEDESNIFNKLWATNFPQSLKEAGYTEMEKNKECPHITLVNSNVVAEIQEGFVSKYGKQEGAAKFESFCKSYVSSMSKGGEIRDSAYPNSDEALSISWYSDTDLFILRSEDF